MATFQGAGAGLKDKLIHIFALKRAVININKKFKCAIINLKPKQIESIYAAASGDLITVLPTGFGKSLVYELIPYYIGSLRCIEQCNCKLICNCDIDHFLSSIVIICPLSAIISEKLVYYRDTAVQVTDCDIHNQTLMQGKFTYILGHPEHLLKNQVLAILKSEHWQNRITHLVVDEAHCIVTWGPDFRKDFKNLDMLRAVIPSTKVVAMTATATLCMRKDIAKSLKLECYKTVSVSCDRPNIFYEVMKRPGHSANTTPEESFDYILEPIITNLQEQGSLYPKTIVFTKLKWCGYGHEAALRRIPSDKLYCSDTSSVYKSRIGQYHAPQADSVKKELSKVMHEPSGHVKLLFATEAYSMGADAPNIRNIIHIGPPSTLETYVQETGRGGRDNNPAKASMYFNNADVAANVKHMTPAMRDFCKTDSCRRLFLMDHFGFEFVQPVPAHTCCDNCREHCVCETCTLSKASADDLCIGIEATSISTTNIIKPAVRMAQALLRQYFDAENLTIANPSHIVHNGLSPKLAATLADDYFKFCNVDTLKLHCPQLASEYIKNISCILNHVKEHFH